MQPGISRDQPVWTREAGDRTDELIRAIDLGMKIVALGYTLMTAWQVAKLLNPQLKVHEEILIAAVRQRFAKTVADKLPELTNADRAAIYDATR